MGTDLRDDLRKFAGRVLKRPLWDHQIEAARSEAFITTIAAARRTGKTYLAELMAIHTAFSHRDCKVLILSATQDAARRLTESIGATLNRDKLTRGAVVDDYSTRIRLTNGSEIISLPASQRQVRGYGAGVRLVILDEAGFMEPALWTAAHYTALDERANGSRILILGSPWGGSDHFFRQSFEAGERGEPDHASFHWTYEANPKLDHAYLERQRERVSPAEYAREILGEWSEAAGSMFSAELLREATAPIEPLSLAELEGGARCLLGVDWGVSYDRSAAVALARLPLREGSKRPIYTVAAIEHWPAGHRLTDVVSEIVASDGMWSVVSSEETGVGAGPTQELRDRLRDRWEQRRELAHHRYSRFGEGRPMGHRQFEPDTWRFNAVPATAQRKSVAYGWILSLLEQGRLVLPQHPDLLRQLAGLRYEERESGVMRIEAESAGTHDDLADALALATAPVSHEGKVACRLGWMDRDGEPDATTPEGEMVTTGAGLEVPLRPTLQSVDGDELTIPDQPTGEPIDPLATARVLVARHLKGAA